MNLRSWLGRVCLSSWFLGAVVGIASWPELLLTPARGLDPSWQTALNLTFPRDLDFGADLIWTYGPLGFIKFPQVTHGTFAVLAALYTIASQIGLGTTLVWGARRTFPLPIAVVIALLVAMVIPDPIVAVVLLWCVVVVGAMAPPAVHRLFPLAAGIVSAIELLAKLNVGLLVLTVCAISVVAMDGERRRNVVTFATSLAAAAVAVWFATGQGIDDLGDLASASVAIIGGYSTAMGREASGPGPAGLRYAFDLALVGAAVLAGYVGSRGLPPVRRVAILLVLGVAAFALWKEAVVRHVWEREANFVTLLAASLLAFEWRIVRVPRMATAWAAPAVVLVTLTAAVAIYVDGLSRRAVDVLDPIDRVDSAITQSSDLLVPGQRRQARDVARLGLAVGYALDRKTLGLLRDAPVHIEPWEVSLAWAYDLEWRPVPVFHSYQAYEPELDQLNADSLASDSGPQRILRHSVGPDGSTLTPSLVKNSSRSDAQYLNALSINGRYGPYDAPAAKLAMLCHFKAVRSSRAYQVLRRVRDRCGGPRPLATVAASYGEPIPVPRPPHGDDVVIARVDGLRPAGLERLQALLFRSEPRQIAFNGVEYQIVPGTAEDGLIVTAPREVDFPRPFALAPNPRTIEFRKEDTLLSPSPELSVEFFALSVRPR